MMHSGSVKKCARNEQVEEEPKNEIVLFSGLYKPPVPFSKFCRMHRCHSSPCVFSHIDLPDHLGEFELVNCVKLFARSCQNSLYDASLASYHHHANTPWHCFTSHIIAASIPSRRTCCPVFTQRLAHDDALLILCLCRASRSQLEST